ncbi:hypothetical protein DL93DRAFT_245045 [Clavulina sp. PMI_390]|nr:hypothetical protein DL93DRAFT_245045 [Clavulina sp. PMI_390]
MIVFTAVVAAIASSLVVHVGAQPQGNSSVHCIPGWDWANNTLNQNPCLVSSWLQAECSDKYIMDPLQPGYHYSGPTTDPSTQNACAHLYYPGLYAWIGLWGLSKRVIYLMDCLVDLLSHKYALAPRTI